MIMKNEDIIMEARVFLMEQGELAPIPNTSMTWTDDDGTRTISIPEEIHTYKEWSELGRQVKKGEHAIAKFPIWIPRNKKKNHDLDDPKRLGEEDLEMENPNPKRFYQKMSFFFKINQTQIKEDFK